MSISFAVDRHDTISMFLRRSTEDGTAGAKLNENHLLFRWRKSANPFGGNIHVRKNCGRRCMRTLCINVII
jgi:hypothetical protein